MKENKVMKLEVGMYVRFTNYDKSCQYIGKIANINEFRETSKKNAVYVSWHNDYLFISDEDIVNASYELIDLAEVDDYVNGYKVLEICTGNFEIGNPYDVTALKLEFVYQDINPKIPFFKRYIFVINNEVESIVTREQFNSMKYVVGE